MSWYYTNNVPKKVKKKKYNYNKMKRKNNLIGKSLLRENQFLFRKDFKTKFYLLRLKNW